jgi:hypothetical protein
LLEGRKRSNGNGESSAPPPPPRDAIERACCMKEELLVEIERLGEKLPPNTLDQLIDELGGPENVAEVSNKIWPYMSSVGTLYYCVADDRT